MHNISHNDININENFNGIRIINIAPITLLNKKWFCVGFEDEESYMEDYFHLALLYKSNETSVQSDLLEQVKKLFTQTVPLVRIHSECILGDSFHSSLCDCGEQLYKSISNIIKHKSGLIIYLRQEGRGIGMRAKLACLAIQEGYIKGKLINKKHTPDEANLALGYKVDERTYNIVPKLLQVLNIKIIKLISGNPDKIEALRKAGIMIDDIIDIPRTKKLTKRQVQEITEKINRNYYYPLFSSK